MKMLDCPNVHCFNRENTQKLFMGLSNCDISIFANKSIQSLLEYSWESTRNAIFGWLFLPFLGYFIMYMVFLELLFAADPEDED